MNIDNEEYALHLSMWKEGEFNGLCRHQSPVFASAKGSKIDHWICTQEAETHICTQARCRDVCNRLTE